MWYLALIKGIMDKKAADQAAVYKEAAGLRAEKIGRDNAAFAEAENKEEQRRLGDEQKKAEASDRAKRHASGSSGGSLELVSDVKAKEHSRQLDWLATSGKRKAKIELEKGTNARLTAFAGADIERAQGTSKLLGSAGTASQWYNS